MEQKIYGKTILDLNERHPPNDTEAEYALLGALMLDKEAIEKVADFLQPNAFYRIQNQIIYEAILHLYKNSEPIDIVTVSSRLKEINKLEIAGGMAYLSDLVNSVPTTAHVNHYGKIIEKKRILRDLISTANDIAGLGYSQNVDVDTLLDNAESRVFAISQHSLSQTFAPLQITLEEAFERIDRLHKGDGKLRGIPTGFTALDNILSGLQKSDLIVLAARPSLGKTTFALDIARHAALKEGKTVGIFSLEMSSEQLVDRLLASQAGVDLWRLRTGRLSSQGPNNDFERIQTALGELSNAKIFIFDSSYVDSLQMRMVARRLQSREGLDLLIVDYLQLMPARDASMPVVQQITEISRSLKGLAKELNIPIIAISQLSRAVEQRTSSIPKLSDLRDSGAIEQDADVVLFISRKTNLETQGDERNMAEIIIAKHRNGPVGKVQLFFDENQVSFKNLETNYQSADFM